MKKPTKAWPDLIASHTHTIRFWAFKYTHDSELAKDLAQDVMLKALISEHLFGHSGDNLKGWLSVLTRNIYINQYRKDKITRNQIEMSDGLYESGLIQNSVSNTAPSEMQTRTLLAAMNKLPENLRTVSLLRAHGYSYEELSKILDIPSGSVRSQLKRGRDRMKEMGIL